MDPALGGKLLGLVIAVVLAGLAAAGQAATFHVNRVRLRGMVESGARRSTAVLSLLEQPGAGLGAVSLLSSLAVFAAAVFTLLLVTDPLFRSPPIAIAAAVAALLALLVAQTLGRVLAVARPEATALVVHRPLALASTLCAPLLLPFVALERRGLAILGVSRPNDPHAAEEQLRHLLDGTRSEGMLERGEGRMIHAIFELSQLPVREIMVPRVEVVGLPDSATVGEMTDVVVTTGHSRLPMYDGTIDRVTGMLYAKDLLRHLRTGSLSDPVAPLAREPHFVPEVKKVDELLQEMQKEQVHVAVVVDEYGGTAGLITIEDLIEEIVGEIRDEYDAPGEEPVVIVNEREAIVDARATIREVNERLSLDLPDDEYDTLGGLVYQQVGHVPAEGEEVRVDGCTLRVIATQGRRIRKVHLTMGGLETAPQ